MTLRKYTDTQQKQRVLQRLCKSAGRRDRRLVTVQYSV